MPAFYAELARRFVAVARSGSIQGAARTLHLSQPSLTQSVRQIEELFGCRLFERTPKGVLLTPMGERLYLRSSKILELEALARAEIEDLLSGRHSQIRMSAGIAWGYGLLPSVIRKLQARYPELLVSLDISLTSDALAQLHAGAVDVVFGGDVENETNGDGIVRRPLLEIQYAAACGADSPLAGQAVTLRDLSAFPIVVYEDDVHLMGKVVAFIEDRIGTKLNIAVRTGSLLASLELVRTGPYVMFAARPSLTRLARQEVKIVDLQEPLHHFSSSIYFRRTLMHSPPFRNLLELVEEVARRESSAQGSAESTK